MKIVHPLMISSWVLLVLCSPLRAELLFDPNPINNILDQVAASDPGVRGISALVSYKGQIVFERYLDGHTNGQVLDLASASKWMSGVTMLTLWDDGVYNLDAPLSSYVPAFANLPTSNAKRNMTMRQLFSHTSGLPSDASRTRQGTLADFAHRVANGTGLNTINLIGPPGDQYLYGDVSMQTAGGIAEILTGQSWVDIFNQNVAGPLGMASTFYETSGGRNPLLAGGGKSPITDYGKMLEMILQRGVYNGTQILSSAAIDQMLTPNTVGLPFLNNPPRFPGSQYGFGLWLDAFDAQGNAVFIDSPGRSGFVPWIDYEYDYWAIVMFDEDNGDHVDEIMAIRSNIISQISAIPESSSLALVAAGAILTLLINGVRLKSAEPLGHEHRSAGSASPDT